jgi:hypothetical protein
VINKRAANEARIGSANDACEEACKKVPSKFPPPARWKQCRAEKIEDQFFRTFETAFGLIGTPGTGSNKGA